MKANCYKCKYRGGVPGSAHSSCRHPKVKGDSDDPLINVMSILASVGRVPPMLGNHKVLNIKGNSYGIRSGWFNWPIDFDPVWLENCDGFVKTKKQ